MTGQHLRDLPVFLRAPRAAGLWLAGVLIGLASVVAFGLSYRGLLVWALHHQWPQGVAEFFPLIVDVLIVVCEVILFTAAIDGGTPWRVRALAWLVLLVFTGISVVGNADHAVTATAWDRGGFALPPLVLAIALGFGLGELKRQAAKYRRGRDGLTGAPGTVPATMPACGHVVGDPADAIRVAVEHARECLDEKVTIRGLSRQTGIDHRKLSVLARNVPAGTYASSTEGDRNGHIQQARGPQGAIQESARPPAEGFTEGRRLAGQREAQQVRRRPQMGQEEEVATDVPAGALNGRAHE